MEILNIQNLTFTYPIQTQPALENISFHIKQGEFITICGQSGCGKTTLLKMLKPALTPHGKNEGTISYKNSRLEDLSAKDTAMKIGYVLQNPDNQIVTDKVWHELAFGLENAGFDTDHIRLRVGEMSSYFGITEWFHESTDTLSGGQKQLLNLAAVMAMSPDLILLDEPTSQLDPIAATEFLNTLKKLNRDLGITVILAEHRLEEAFCISDRVMVMENGRIAAFDTPEIICKALKGQKIAEGFPTASRIWQASGLDCDCPLTVNEGRRMISEYFNPAVYAFHPQPSCEDTVLELKNAWFRYEKDGKDILKNTCLKIQRKEFFCLLGANAAGKSTALKVFAGTADLYRGKLLVNGKARKRKDISIHEIVAMLPQNPLDVFLRDTVYEDLSDVCDLMGYDKKSAEEAIRHISSKLMIENLLDKHPFDLSGGEQQKCALAKLLLRKPEILLLDEPTKGIDAYAKRELLALLSEYITEGMTVLCVTHDVEFAAMAADRCALFFDGEIIASAPPEIFFARNHFYTTAASRITRDVFRNTVTVEQVQSLMKGNRK